MTDGTLLLARRFDAPVARVFRACVDPGQMARWLLPGDDRRRATVHCDARKGGLFRLEGLCGDERPFAMSGSYLVYVEPTLLVMTWCYEGPDHDLLGSDFVVRVVLNAVTSGSTDLTLTHERNGHSTKRMARARPDRAATARERSEGLVRTANLAGTATPHDQPASMRRGCRSS